MLEHLLTRYLDTTHPSSDSHLIKPPPTPMSTTNTNASADAMDQSWLDGYAAGHDLALLFEDTGDNPQSFYQSEPNECIRTYGCSQVHGHQQVHSCSPNLIDTSAYHEGETAVLEAMEKHARSVLRKESHAYASPGLRIVAGLRRHREEKPLPALPAELGSESPLSLVAYRNLCSITISVALEINWIVNFFVHSLID